MSEGEREARQAMAEALAIIHDAANEARGVPGATGEGAIARMEALGFIARRARAALGVEVRVFAGAKRTAHTDSGEREGATPDDYEARLAIAKVLDLWSDDTFRETIDGMDMAGKILDALHEGGQPAVGNDEDEPSNGEMVIEAIASEMKECCRPGRHDGEYVHTDRLREWYERLTGQSLPEGVARTAPSPVLYDELREAAEAAMAAFDRNDDEGIEAAHNWLHRLLFAGGVAERPPSAPIPKED